MTIPFAPSYGSATAIDVNTSSQSLTLPAGTKSVRVVNFGNTDIIYFRIGSGDQNASNNDCAVLPLSELIVSKDADFQTFAYATVSGETTGQVMVGEHGSN
jgi:hypothetical protein